MSIDFAVNSLIDSKGKHRKQFALMDDELKNYFFTLQKLLGAVAADYESFLWKQSCENPKLAKKFLPDCLKDKLDVVKPARDNALA
jgi:hypothetical protein